MEITFSYKITELEKAPSLNGLSDVVTKVSFIYSGEAEDGTKVEWPTITAQIPTPGAEAFTPFAELTEADVIAWLEVCYPMGPVKEMITKKIDDELNPKDIVTEFPWA